MKRERALVYSKEDYLSVKKAVQEAMDAVKEVPAADLKNSSDVILLAADSFIESLKSNWEKFKGATHELMELMCDRRDDQTRVDAKIDKPFLRKETQFDVSPRHQ